MANKFLGEAGLAVLVEEIKKKAGSENKSLLDTMLEGLASWNNLTGEMNTIEDEIIFQKSISISAVLMAIVQEFMNVEAPSLATPPERLNWINEQLDNTPEGSLGTARVLLSDDCIFITVLIDACQTVTVTSDGIQYRNLGDHTWRKYNPVSEISADEVTEKFNS